MKIEFIVPFTRAWERMKSALFSPFDLQKWGIIGFNAFLAGLLDSILVLIIGTAIFLVLLWLSSRGKFMFLAWIIHGPRLPQISVCGEEVVVLHYDELQAGRCGEIRPA